jgi:hypothetical protein
LTAAPVTGEDYVIPHSNVLEEVGHGLPMMLETVPPILDATEAACSVGG